MSDPATPRPRRLFAASLAPSIGRAPSRFRIWRAGPNAWDLGVVNLTPAALESVIAEFQRRSNPLSMDFEHAISLSPDPAVALPTAGYVELEAVDGELWAVARWSDCGREAPVPEVVCCARHQIESGQRITISPDWTAIEATGEPVRINRISLVADPATFGASLLASRAAAGRRGGMDEMSDARAAYRHASRMAGSKDPDEKKMGEAMCAKMKAAASALGADIEKEPEGGAPPPKPEEEKKPETAAELPPKPEEEKKPEAGATAGALASRQAQTPPTLTLATALQAFDAREAERAQLNTLLAANKDRLGEKTIALLASKGLTNAREFIETLPARPAPTGTGGDAGGAVPHTPGGERPWRKPLTTERERFMASRVRDQLGITEEDEALFDKRVDPDGGITISLVDIVKSQRAARLAGKASVAT